MFDGCTEKGTCFSLLKVQNILGEALDFGVFFNYLRSRGDNHISFTPTCWIFMSVDPNT